jgi:hypothetical protein
MFNCIGNQLKPKNMKNITTDVTREKIIRTWKNTRTGGVRQEELTPVILTEANGSKHSFYQDINGRLYNVWDEDAKIMVDVTKYY